MSVTMTVTERMRRQRALASPAFMACALVACSGPSPEPSAPDSGSAALLGNQSAVDAMTASGCAAGTTQPYVLSSDAVLYRFNPPSKAFTAIGPLSCWAPGMSPNSMAIDRSGTAWVDYVTFAADGSIAGGAMFQASIVDGTCHQTAIILPSGWEKFGMAFSTASATDSTETLYVAAAVDAPCGGDAGGTGLGLGMFDPSSPHLARIGAASPDFTGFSAELTGTGDGRLFGFFDKVPPTFAQIDKTSGATSNEVALANLDCPVAFAFSFWGGDLYVFSSATETGHSSVTQYDMTTGETDANYLADVGFQIIGAGVSTCAPTSPPPR